MSNCYPSECARGHGFEPLAFTHGRIGIAIARAFVHKTKKKKGKKKKDESFNSTFMTFKLH